MKRMIAALGLLVAAVLLTVAPAAQATDEPEVISAPCTGGNTDCGDWPDEVPPGTPCKIKVDGEWLEGETDGNGVCVCEYTPPSTTTTSTVPETTTTTVAPTTSTTVVTPTTETPTTQVPTTETPTTEQPVPTPPPPTQPLERPAEAEVATRTQLPRTGSSTTTFAVVGGLLLLAGVLLVKARNWILT